MGAHMVAIDNETHRLALGFIIDLLQEKMDRHQRNVIINEKLLRKYLVLSPTVIKVMEQDRLFPESFVTRLKTLRPLDQNSFMIEFVVNFPGVEAYENFMFLLRKTSQSWLGEIIESGKSVDTFMRFRPDELAQAPGNYDVYNNNPTTGFDPLFGQISGDLGGTYDFLMGTDSNSYAADGLIQNAGFAPAQASLAATGLVDMVRECRQRQINAEQRVVNLQREQLALKARIGENQREQIAIAAEQVSLRQLAANADRVARMARQTEVVSSLARASLPNVLPQFTTPAILPPRRIPPAIPTQSSYSPCYNRTTKLGILHRIPSNNDPPVPMTSSLTLNELSRLGQGYS